MTEASAAASKEMVAAKQAATMVSLLLLASLAASPARAQGLPAPAVSDRLEAALSRARARRGDLDVRPGRWDTRFTQPPIEELLSDPVALGDRASEWGGRLAAVQGAAAFCAFGGSLLGLPTEAPRSASAVSTAAAGELPPPLAEAVGDLAIALARARPFLDLASAGLSPSDRERLTAGFMAQLRHGPAERLDPALFDLAARFDRAALWQALRVVAEAADRAAAALAAGPAPQGPLPRSLVVAGSTFTLGGAGDDSYAEEELAGSAVVFDLGGRNRYLGAPAAAGPGEIKVVVDLGSEVVVDSSGPVASGRFGIGLMALPDAGGPKRLRGGPFSLGAGFFGAGILLARGAGSSFESGDFSQGAAAFGLGVLDAEGADSSFVAPMAAQGFAFTGAVGLFRAKGARARLECGLVYPDPRDEVAALSLCQGVGYGPRAFAAGGFGLARVESDGAQLDSNYFAQGAGYWHSFGGLYFAGDGARIQSRRYGQGAGIHTAVGALELAGSRNRLLHWGVGPGFGWDWGAGFAAVRGAGNEVYSEWASGKGDVNGHGFAVVEGEGSRIRLGEGGTGTFRRGAPSYGVVVVSGTASYWLPRLSSPTAMGAALVSSLWGAVENDGAVALDAGLSFEAPRWRPMQAEREEAARADREVNAARLAEADRLPAKERLARWLFLAAEGGLDGRTPGEALNRLLSLPDAEAALLPALVAPERFDELVYLRAVIPAYGARLVPALEAAWASASGVRKALLLGFLRGGPAEAGLKAVVGLKRERDWRVRREALGILGSLFDHSRGEEPGRLAFLEETLTLCKRPDPKAPLAPETIERIGQKRLSDLLAALALDPATGAGDRLELLLRAPDPFNPVSADGLNAYAAIWGRRPEACRRVVERELKDAKRLEPQAHERLVEAAKEASPDLFSVALIALGQLGWSKDAARLAEAFRGDTAGPREAAASGLARMGKAAESRILAALRAAPAPVRALAVAAAAQSSDPGVFHLLARGFDDPAEEVRLAAIGGLSAAQIPNHRLRKDFVPPLDRLASSDPSASVRASAAYAAATFR